MPLSIVLRRAPVHFCLIQQDEPAGNCMAVAGICVLTEINTDPLPRMPCDSGAAVERAGQSRKQADLRRPPVVRNPYNNICSTRSAAVAPVAVTPDAVVKRSSQSPRSRVSAASAVAQRAPASFEPEGVREWEAGEESGFKQSPSLITVRDVYPPELSRFVQSLRTTFLGPVKNHIVLSPLDVQYAKFAAIVSLRSA